MLSERELILKCTVHQNITKEFINIFLCNAGVGNARFAGRRDINKNFLLTIADAADVYNCSFNAVFRQKRFNALSDRRGSVGKPAGAEADKNQDPVAAPSGARQTRCAQF
jgi:hypothetical protein